MVCKSIDIKMITTTAIASFETTSCDDASPRPCTEQNSIGLTTTPSMTTPVISEDAMRVSAKRALSLDLEMRSRKRRVRARSVNEAFIVYYTSPTSSLRFPNLIPVEDCCDSDTTSLPDTSFLRQKKPLAKAKRRNALSFNQFTSTLSLQL
mmetsp:Transcript_20427/g.50775  ORF Transcript_20427/g.50775 Transcript_20427/m.50775 type:complete len:151 (+) Transcript_20427:225-677(+)